MIYETLVDFVNSVSAWYWLLAIGIFAVTLLAAFIWENWWLVAYGALLGGILVCGATYIEPSLLGWLSFTGLRMWISFVFCVMWCIVVLQTLYNALTEGSVIE